MRKLIVLITLALLSSELFASSVSILIDDPNYQQVPPSDLVYNERSIDQSETFELWHNGQDLSLLNPEESNLWQNTSHSIRPTFQGPDAEEAVLFESFKAAPSENFRAIVRSNSGSAGRYEIIGSLDNHTHILRAALLRLIGYDVDLPQYYPSLKIRFRNEEEAQSFIDVLGEKTLTQRERWVQTREGNTVTFKGLIVSSAIIRNVNIYIPVMTREKQSERRIFRSLLGLYALTDFPQNINRLGTSVGRVFDGSLIFNHPYADKFRETMLFDLQWLHERLLNLDREDVRRAVAKMSLPRDISALILEKLLMRINYLTELYWARNSHKIFETNPYITMGRVNGGRLTQDLDEGRYVVDFYDEDPESPYRFRELFKLFSTQVLYGGVSSALDYVVQNFVPGLRIDDAVADIQSQMQEWRDENPDSDGVLPLKMWTRPLVNGNVFARRNIVFGQFMNTSAPIQLVDSIGAELYLGAYGAVSGLSNTYTPNITAGVSLGRTYTHIRPMPDLRTATKQRVRNLLVPWLLRKLGKVLNGDIVCSLPEDVWVEESTLAGNPVFYVKYDQQLENGRELALAKRQDLIDQGTEEGQIILRPVDRNQLCIDDITNNRNQNVEEFVKQFALNETFVITDTIKIHEKNGLPIPIAMPAGPPINISVANDNSVAILRNIFIKRTEDGMEVTVQAQRNRSHTFETGLNYILDIFRNTNTWLNGHTYTKIYKIPLDNVESTEEKQQAMRAIRELLMRSSHRHLESHYPPIELDHHVRARLRSFKLFFWKIERVKFNHVLEVVIPNRGEENYSRQMRTRRFFMTMDARRRGNDYYNFIDRTLQSQTGFISLGSTDTDPGISPFGRSKKKIFTTEIELTEGQDEKMVTKVEFGHTGWRMRYNRFMSLLDDVENMYVGLRNYNMIDRAAFQGMSKVRSYDIKNVIILYPRAIEKILSIINSPKIGQAILSIMGAYGESGRWERRDCDQKITENFQIRNRHDRRVYRRCIPLKVRRILSYRGENWDTRSRIGKAKAANKLFKRLFKKIDNNSLLKWIGEENFFASIKISGYREQHAIGALQYISNTVGQYDPELQTGPIDTISTWLNVSNYEFRGLFYTPGF